VLRDLSGIFGPDFKDAIFDSKTDTLHRHVRVLV